MRLSTENRRQTLSAADECVSLMVVAQTLTLLLSLDPAPCYLMLVFVANVTCRPACSACS